jgi:hypothetical protein
MLWNGPGGGYNAELRIETLTGIVSLSSGAGYVTALTLGDTTSGRLFLPVKFVADFTTGFYSRLLVGSERFDISGQALGAGGATLTESVYISFRAVGRTATNGIIDIGRVALTTDEP